MKQLRVALLCAFALGLGIGTVEVVGQMWIGGSLGGFLLAQFGTSDVTTIPELPVNPAPYTRRLITDGQTFNDCTLGEATVSPFTVDCLYDPNLGAWRATDTPTDLQMAYEQGAVGGWTSLPSSRPLTVAPNGVPGVQEQIYGESGDLRRDCLNGTTQVLCHPPSIDIYPDRRFAIRALMGTAPFQSWETVLSYENDGGTAILASDRGTFANVPTAVFTGQRYTVIDCATALCATGGGTSYAIVVTKIWNGAAWVNESMPWHVPWSAQAALVDGTSCVTQAQALINSGPSIVSVVCADAAGTIEVSFDTPARYSGGSLTVCFEINDPVDADSVWEASVQAMFRGAGSVVNNTWATAASDASVTLSTAHANYYACTAVTPNGAAAGIGRVFIKATIDNAGGHTDSNARVFGGYVTGN